jgi:PKD repeat protein
MKTQLFAVIAIAATSLLAKAQTPDFSPNHDISLCGPNDVYFVCTSPDSPNNIWWDFGDSTTGTGINPVHYYASSGTYSVKMIVEKNGVKDSITKENFVVVNALPEPRFEKETTRHLEPFKRRFKFTGFPNADSIRTYTWMVNDTVVANTMNLVYVFSRVDKFKVGLLVENSNGCVALVEDSIAISGQDEPTGIAENSLQHNCFVSLMPKEQLLRVEIKGEKAQQLTFRLVDITGKVLIKESLNTDKREWFFNVEPFSQGMLIVEIQSESGRFARKVQNILP